MSTAGYAAPERAAQRRYDIQGIRVIGALLVFSFHVFFSGVSGGVDVFFVISGYFLAANALQRGELSRPAPLLAFYRNFLLRVAPQAIGALVGICFLLFFFMSPMVWTANLRDIMASALYLENVRLINKGQDYLARSEALTLVQHFWAVSLIGQTYFSWPFILRLNLHVARWMRKESRSMLIILVAALSGMSFAWSIYATAVNPTSAYFSFFTRFWEFGCGVLLGLQLQASTHRAMGYKAALSWLAVVLLVSCGFAIGSTLAFPGYASLWPVAGALLLIRYGDPADKRNVGWILSRRWLSGLAAVSFGVYLWHWPLYVVYQSMTQVDSVPLGAGVILLALSVACAFGTKTLVEWLLSLRWVAANRTLAPAGLLGLLLVISVSSEVVRRHTIAHGRDWDKEQMSSIGFIAPGPFSVRDDNAVVYENGCHQNGVAEEVKTCSFGKQREGNTIMLVGGSHSTQWLPALMLHAAREDWHIVSMTKSGCLFADPDDEALFSSLHDSCAAWNEAALEKILELKPQLVLSLGTRHRDTEAGREEYVPSGYLERFDQLAAHGIQTLALRDNPWLDKDVPVCVYSPMIDDKSICGDERAEVLNDRSFAASRARLPAHVRMLDMSKYFCDAKTCWATRNGVAIYRDSNHITKTYAEKISPALRDAVKAVWRR